MIDKTDDVARLNAHLAELNNAYEVQIEELKKLGGMMAECEKEIIGLKDSYMKVKYELKRLDKEMNNTKTLIRAERI